MEDVVGGFIALPKAWVDLRTLSKISKALRDKQQSGKRKAVTDEPAGLKKRKKMEQNQPGKGDSGGRRSNTTNSR
ncbi:hypothetical protein L484_006139 [Morus notabilis]|uniref:Uncharacterized protein n=1 Tax=Morus notabilis TaxID=981085 RepID=W9QJT3_9ROSA|nr:hypothetical protein L484_006139 [Morus notabilis]